VTCFGTGGRDEARASSILSLDTGISQRHLSFVESGRSVPSRDLLSTVSEALDIPLRERNVLPLASGYAPLYSEYEWDTPEMAAVTHAVDLLLLQHEPDPALVLDRYWNVIRTNASAPRSSAPLSTSKRGRDPATFSISSLILKVCGPS
jgi:transcriptional regulator with XRE-family HTH domain